MKYAYRVTVVAHAANAVNTVSDKNTISMYPNPAKDLLYFNADNTEINSIEIFDIKGRTIFRNKYNSRNIQINIGQFNQGIYYAKVQTTDGIKVNKLVIQ
jgi:hypothetical protein